MLVWDASKDGQDALTAGKQDRERSQCIRKNTNAVGPPAKSRPGLSAGRRRLDIQPLISNESSTMLVSTAEIIPMQALT